VGVERSRVGWLAVIAILGGTTAIAQAADDDADTVWIGSWRLETPLGTAHGTLLYLVADRGAWRCELAVAEAGDEPRRTDLLHRRGRGWTLVGGPDGGYVQPWDEGWQALASASEGALAQLLRVWTGASPRSGPAGRGPGAPGGRSPGPQPVVLDRWEDLPADWRPPDELPSTGGDLRRRLTSRGRGRGGPGLVLYLRPRAAALEVGTTRWPGRLTVAGPVHEVADVPAEAYLPLWPLADFLD